jgi:hypothetical protein
MSSKLGWRDLAVGFEEAAVGEPVDASTPATPEIC